jgi:hypothetical protein
MAAQSTFTKSLCPRSSIRARQRGPAARVSRSRRSASQGAAGPGYGSRDRQSGGSLLSFRTRPLLMAARPPRGLKVNRCSICNSDRLASLYDSLLEGSGFEPSVPLRECRRSEPLARKEIPGVGNGVSSTGQAHVCGLCRGDGSIGGGRRAAIGAQTRKPRWSSEPRGRELDPSHVFGNSRCKCSAGKLSIGRSILKFMAAQLRHSASAAPCARPAPGRLPSCWRMPRSRTTSA